MQIVVSEIDSLERRVRAFSEFSSEPPVQPRGAGRQRAGHRARVAAAARASRNDVRSHGSTRAGLECTRGADLVKGILTNLLQNAAEAAGPGGSVLVVTRSDDDQVAIEVHDSGPGISEEASAHALRADHHLQEARHGTGPVDREEERAAVGRRHHARRRRARRRGVQGDAAAAEPWPQAAASEPIARDAHMPRHIVIVDDEPNIGLVAAADSRGRRLPRHGLRVRGDVSGRASQAPAPISTCWTSGCPTATASTCCDR